MCETHRLGASRKRAQRGNRKLVVTGGNATIPLKQLFKAAVSSRPLQWPPPRTKLLAWVACEKWPCAACPVGAGLLLKPAVLGRPKSNRRSLQDRQLKGGKKGGKKRRWREA